jgi:hypothetical protein
MGERWRSWDSWDGFAHCIGRVFGRRDTLREQLHRHKKKANKAKAAKNKTTIASVTREMAQPRMAQSVAIEAGKQVKI